jgi:Uma2 family endonuclease
MTAMHVAERMTADEFLALPVPQRGRPHNLIDGELVVNDPTWLHGSCQGRVFIAIQRWCQDSPDRGAAHVPVDVRLDDRNVFAPDVVHYRAGRVPKRSDRPPYPMPDLAVEVRSPSTWRYDIGAKKAGYEHHGLPELWLVDTAADEVLVFRRSRAGAARFDVALELARGNELTSPRLPGFALPLDELFAIG